MAVHTPVHFKGKVGNDGGQVGIPIALAITVHRALHHDGSGFQSRQAHGHAYANVVVAMHADTSGGKSLHHRPRDFLYLRHELAAIGLAKYEKVGTASFRRFQGGEGVLGVVEITVVEVFGVVDDLLPLLLEVADGILDHCQVLLRGGADHLGYVQKPALPEYGDYGGGGIKQKLNLGIFFYGYVCPASGTEGRQLCVFQIQTTRLFEEGHVPRVRPGPATLDIVDAELIELFGHPHFCSYGERNTFSLRTVSQGGVVYQYFGIGLVVHDM